MPRPRPPHLHLERTRHGRKVWYVRVDKGPRVRIRADFGTPDFDQEYQAALAGTPRPKRGAPAAGTLAWLIERYRDSSDWRAYSLPTRRQRETIFRQVIATAGATPVTRITEAVIVAGRERRKETPFQARHFLDAMRGLFAWAVAAGHAKTNPAANVKYPAIKSGRPGFPVWTEDDVAAYEARWPLGTRQRVWLAVLLFTGLRRGDAVRLGRQHFRNGVAVIKTEKTGQTVAIPILAPLAEVLEAGPTGDLAYICGERASR